MSLIWQLFATPVFSKVMRESYFYWQARVKSLHGVEARVVERRVPEHEEEAEGGQICAL